MSENKEKGLFGRVDTVTGTLIIIVAAAIIGAIVLSIFC